MKVIDNFVPDLVIEATNACDKQCQGCYAPNILVGSKVKNSVGKVKNLELKKLKSIWSTFALPIKIDVISVRGGEPTLNPYILDILDFLNEKSNRLILETNGEWISNNSNLIKDLNPKSTLIKLSADSMHGSVVSKVQLQLQILESYKFTTLLAITAESLEEFEKFYFRMGALDCIPVFQKKAFSFGELIKPKVGVISADGQFNKTLTTTKSFDDLNYSESVN
jgi:organic radical activating enzyme